MVWCILWSRKYDKLLSFISKLQVVGFENIATVDPHSYFHVNTEAYDCPHSRMARLALAVSVFMIIFVVQVGQFELNLKEQSFLIQHRKIAKCVYM